MTTHVAKVIEVVGTSDVSIEDAIKAGIHEAAGESDHLQWFQVLETRGSIAGQKIERFQVILKLAYGVES